MDEGEGGSLVQVAGHSPEEASNVFEFQNKTEDESYFEDEEQGESCEGSSEDVKPGSVVRLRSEASLLDGRIQWERVNLLCLNVKFDPNLLLPECKFEPDENSFRILLDMSLLREQISLDERNWLADKYKLLADNYKKVQDNIKELNDDNILCRDTLIDHRKIDEWFESLPTSYEAEEKIKKKTKEKFFDVVQNRMQILAYRNKLVIGEIEACKYDSQIKKAQNDKKVLEQIIHSYTDEGNLARLKLKQDIKSLLEDIEALKNDLAEEDDSYLKVDLHMKGETKKNEALLGNLKRLEEASEKMKTNLKQSKDAIEETLEELMKLKKKAAAVQSKYDAGNKEYMEQTRHIEKMQRLEKKEAATYKSLIKAVAAKTDLVNEWSSKLGAVKDKAFYQQEELDYLNYQINALNSRGSKLYQARNTLKKLVNKYRRDSRIREAALTPLKEFLKDKKHVLETMSADSERLAVDPEETAQEKIRIEREIERCKRDYVSSMQNGKEEESYYKKLVLHVKELQAEQCTFKKEMQNVSQEIGLYNRLLEREKKENKQIKLDLELFVDKLALLGQEKTTHEKLLETKQEQFKEFYHKFAVEKVEKANDALRKVKLANEKKEWKYRIKINDTETERFIALQKQSIQNLEQIRSHLTVEKVSYKENEIELERVKAEIKNSKFEEECRRAVVMNTKADIYKAQMKGENSINRLLKVCLDRNHKALSLRDQYEEEIFYMESVNIYEDMLKVADSEYDMRGLVIDKLKLKERQEIHEKYILEKNCAKSNEMLRQLEDVVMKLEEITQKQLELEAKFSGERHQLVRIKQTESPEEVNHKLEVLENLVMREETRVTEFRMIQGQVKRLLTTLEKQKPVKCETAMKMKSAGSQLKTENRNKSTKMKTAVVELAFLKSQAEELKRKLEEEKREHLEAVKNFEQGLPPTVQMQKEWEKEVARLRFSDRNKTDEEKLECFDGSRLIQISMSKPNAIQKRKTEKCLTSLKV